MLRIVLLTAFVVGAMVASAGVADSVLHQRVLDSAYALRLNRQNLGWTAGVNGAFAGETDAQFVARLGDKTPEEGFGGHAHSTAAAPMPSQLAAIPASFDARHQWPSCQHPILNQGRCGSCWAHSAATALGIRYCIAQENAKNATVTPLSPQYLVSCDNYENTQVTADTGCNGGWAAYAWAFMEREGIPSASCQPYVSGDGDGDRECTWEGCNNMEKKACPAHYHAEKGTTTIFQDEPSIQLELMTNGPMSVSFMVYDDFKLYQAGVYSKSPDAKALGGHAVVALGWGEESDGTKFWTVQNSWSEHWGENGTFRIVRGGSDVANCGIQRMGVAGLAGAAQ